MQLNNEPFSDILHDSWDISRKKNSQPDYEHQGKMGLYYG